VPDAEHMSPGGFKRLGQLADAQTTSLPGLGSRSLHLAAEAEPGVGRVVLLAPGALHPAPSQRVEPRTVGQVARA